MDRKYFSIRLSFSHVKYFGDLSISSFSAKSKLSSSLIRRVVPMVRWKLYENCHLNSLRESVVVVVVCHDKWPANIPCSVLSCLVLFRPVHHSMLCITFTLTALHPLLSRFLVFPQNTHKYEYLYIHIFKCVSCYIYFWSLWLAVELIMAQLSTQSHRKLSYKSCNLKLFREQSFNW